VDTDLVNVGEFSRRWWLKDVPGRIECPALLEASPQEVSRNIEHMEHDASAAQVRVGKLLCPLCARPKPVLKDDVGAVVEEGEGVPVEDQLKPLMKLRVLMRDAELGLKVIGANPEARPFSLQPLRQSRLSRTGPATEQRQRG